MEPEGSLPHSQEPATYSYPELSYEFTDSNLGLDPDFSHRILSLFLQ
jgi:hypothetical protein